MKKLKLILVMILVLIIPIGLTSCNNATTVEHNIQKEANKFNVYRRMRFINLNSDKILYEVEGYFSLQTTYDNQYQGQQEIGIIIETGKDEYKMHYFSVDNNIAYVIEQVENTHTDPYHWEINWYIPVVY